jgi:hypothetical protein
MYYLCLRLQCCVQFKGLMRSGALIVMLLLLILLCCFITFILRVQPRNARCSLLPLMRNCARRSTSDARKQDWGTFMHPAHKDFRPPLVCFHPSCGSTLLCQGFQHTASSAKRDTSVALDLVQLSARLIKTNYWRSILTLQCFFIQFYVKKKKKKLFRAVTLIWSRKWQRNYRLIFGEVEVQSIMLFGLNQSLAPWVHLVDNRAI